MFFFLSKTQTQCFFTFLKISYQIIFFKDHLLLLILRRWQFLGQVLYLLFIWILFVIKPFLYAFTWYLGIFMFFFINFKLPFCLFKSSLQHISFGIRCFQIYNCLFILFLYIFYLFFELCQFNLWSIVIWRTWTISSQLSFTLFIGSFLTKAWLLHLYWIWRSRMTSFWSLKFLNLSNALFKIRSIWTSWRIASIWFCLETWCFTHFHRKFLTMCEYFFFWWWRLWYLYELSTLNKL